MFMLCQASVKIAVLLHKQASDRFHSLLTVCMYLHISNFMTFVWNVIENKTELAVQSYVAGYRVLHYKSEQT